MRLAGQRLAPANRRTAPRIGTSRRCAVRVVAFTEGFRDSSAVPIKASYYTLLQLRDESGLHADAIRAAFESLVVAPTQAAYSADTLFSRAVLLKSAAECLANVDLKRGYDQKLSSGLHEVKVAQADLPGALVLLQETGEHEHAIELATTWLRPGWLKKADVPDVATCLALALCDRAGATLATDGALQEGTSPLDSPMLRACDDLERALHLCQEHDVAHALQDHITDALKGYAHLYAVDLVSLPCTLATASQRLRGLELLREVVQQDLPTEEQELQAHNTKVEDMLRRARGALTASEQVHLHKDLKACKALAGKPAAGIAYDTALAYLAEGYAQGWPHYIHCADLLLQEAERAVVELQGEAPKQVSESPVALERACCALLLRDHQSAFMMLGLVPGSPHPADPEIKAFVKANSTSGDLMPGVMALAQSWLAEAVLGGFREWSSDPTRIPSAVQSLTPWFQHPGAALYCKVYSVVRSGPLLTIMHVLCNLPKLIQALMPTKPPAPTTTTPASTTATTTQPTHSRPSSMPASTAPTAKQSPTKPQSGNVAKGQAVMAVTAVTELPDEVPDQPLMAISELVEQADSLTLDQLVSRLPKGLMPMRRNVVESEMADGESENELAAEMAASQKALRQQLDQMEKAMWDAPSSSASGTRSVPLVAQLPRLIGLMVVGFIIVANAASFMTGPVAAAGRVMRPVMAITRVNQ